MKRAIEKNIRNRRETALRLTDDDGVTLPARTSVFVNVMNDTFQDYEGIAEDNMRLLLGKGTYIGRGFVKLEIGGTPMSLTIFSNERRHLAKDAARQIIQEVTDVTHLTTQGRHRHIRVHKASFYLRS